MLGVTFIYFHITLPCRAAGGAGVVLGTPQLNFQGFSISLNIGSGVRDRTKPATSHNQQHAKNNLKKINNNKLLNNKFNKLGNTHYRVCVKSVVFF